MAGHIADHAHMEVAIGTPLTPPRVRGPKPSRDDLHDWHAAVMGEISRLSGKAWNDVGDQRCAATTVCMRGA
jgi:hypothetical protein